MIGVHSEYHLPDIFFVNIFSFSLWLIISLLSFENTFKILICHLDIFSLVGYTFFYFNLCVCVYEYMPNVYRFPWKPKEDAGSPGAEITCGCEPYNEC